MIGACKEDGRWAEALALLSLIEQQHPPDVVSGLTSGLQLWMMGVRMVDKWGFP